PPGTHGGLAERVAQILKVRPNQVELQPAEESLYHGELTLDQILFMRPVPGWSRYRTPIEGLCWCGSGTHPGGGIAGAAGRSGARHSYYNVCRHRGTRLCEAPKGRLSETIQCPYHAWTYALDGRLIGAPHMHEVEGFDKKSYPLHTVALTEWEGFLFVNLDPQATPATTWFAPLEARSSRYNLPLLQTGCA